MSNQDAGQYSTLKAASLNLYNISHWETLKQALKKEVKKLDVQRDDMPLAHQPHDTS